MTSFSCNWGRSRAGRFSSALGDRIFGFEDGDAVVTVRKEWERRELMEVRLVVGWVERSWNKIGRACRSAGTTAASHFRLRSRGQLLAYWQHNYFSFTSTDHAAGWVVEVIDVVYVLCPTLTEK